MGLEGYNWNPNGNPVAGDNLTFGGSVRLNPNNNYGAGTNFGSITFAAGAGAFTLGGNSLTLGGAITNNSTNLQIVNLPLILSATRTVNTATGDIQVGAAVSGAGGLTKTGTHTLFLTGNNTFTGPATVSDGTLELTGAGALTGTTQVAVNTGGTLLLGSSTADQIKNDAAVTLNGGTIQTGTSGMSESVGALTLSSSSIIDFGTLASGATLVFASSSAITWTGTLNVWNWTIGSDHLFFGSTYGAGVTTGQLGQIAFYSGSGTGFMGTATYASAGEVSPVPEPSSVLMSLSLLSLAGYRERRWLFRCRAARRLPLS